jgi:hypothetical protein
MINPKDIDITKPLLNAQRLADIEQQFDTAIRLAHNSGRWPARVADARDSASPVEIEHVADKYRTAGWKVATDQKSARAFIDHPDRDKNKE